MDSKWASAEPVTCTLFFLVEHILFQKTETHLSRLSLWEELNGRLQLLVSPGSEDWT